MESEKVKEIKKALECCKDYKTPCGNCPYHDINECKEELIGDMGDCINELESENERLRKSDTSKEESSIEYYNLYKDLKRKNKDLNELCELQRVNIAENFVKENQLKDRIAELEKEKKDYYDRLNNLQTYIDNHEEVWKRNTNNALKQFAERLKEKAVSFEGERTAIVSFKSIDETLKEFMEVKE